MELVDLIAIADQVITCSGPPTARDKTLAAQIGMIEHGAVAMAGGVICGVGTKDDILARFRGGLIHLPNSSIVPGLVDPHSHPLWAGDRKHEFALRAKGASYEDIHAAGGGIAHTVNATRQADAATLKASMIDTLEKMASFGTTTLEAKSGYGLSYAEELRQLEIIKEVADSSFIEIVATCMGAHAIPEDLADDRAGFLKMITDQLLPAVRERQLAMFVDVFCERGAFSCQESEDVLRRAQELGFGLRIHAEEFSNLGGSRMAATLGAASCDHLQHIHPDDFPALRAGGTIATVLPGTSLFLDLDHYAPARQLWDAGLPVALGTDYNAGSCLMPSMQMAMSLAVLKMKMTPEEALTAATVNAAHSLGLAQRIGSLEVGKQADLLILNSKDWRDMIYQFGGNSVRAVIKKGVLLNTVLQSPLGAPL